MSIRPEARFPRRLVPEPGPVFACPRCGDAQRLTAERPERCRGCGTGLLVEGDRVLDVASYPVRVEATDVARVLAEHLRRRRSPRQERLLEIHHLELPYWRAPGGELQAAFPSWVEAIRRLEAPAVETRPAAIAGLPAIPAGAIAPAPEGLVLVPVYDVRYRVRGRSYHAFIEAVTGRVLGDLYPPPLTVRVHVLMAAVLALDVAAFAGAAYLSPNNLVRTIAIATLAFPIHALTAAAFRLRER